MGEPSASDEQLLSRALASQRLAAARAKVLQPELLPEPVWNMLVDLYVCRARGEQVSVTSACVASQFPPTTALRHLQAMAESGAIVRRPDPRDGRRVYVELTAAGLLAVRSVLLSL